MSRRANNYLMYNNICGVNMTIFSNILDQEISLILDLNNQFSNEQDGHIKGTALEVRLNSLLTRFLPSNVSLARGWIVDNEGNRSDERDCLLYDKTKAPAFLFDCNTGMIPLISILYDIQIKSKLTEKNIRQAFEKFDNRIPHNALIGNKGKDILKIYEKIDPYFYESPKIHILLSENSGYYVFNIEEKTFDEIFDFENSITIENKGSFKFDYNYDKNKIIINGIKLSELCKKKIKICRWAEYSSKDVSKLKVFFIGLSNTLFKTNIGKYLHNKDGIIKYHSLVLFDHNNNIFFKRKLGESTADVQDVGKVQMCLNQEGNIELKCKF